MTRLFLLSLLTYCARAEPFVRTPDYVATYAPMLWLHSDDPYMPSDLLTHIHHTTPMVDGEPIPGLPPLDLDNLEILNAFGDQVALTADEEDPITHSKWLLGETPDAAGKVHNATPCVVILVEKSEIELDAFYFYFYSYNEGGNITQVLDPIAGLIRGSKAGSGMHFGDHVGDWENNMIRYRDGKPIGIFFSQHDGGAAYDWDDPILSKTDGRPIIYSARGSHANYPAPGNHVHSRVLVDYCDEGPKWDPILSAYFYHFDPDTLTFTPLVPPNQPASSPPPASNLTSFIYFSGIWGDKKYPDSDPRQETVPYFGIKRFVDGPTGPIHKPLVRKGLMPDNKRRVGWTEWAVGVFMALYPHLFKGWRLWVLIGVVIVSVVGVVLGIWFVKRRKTRDYSRVGGGDIPLDDWGVEEEALLSSSDEDESEGDRKSR